MITNHGIIGLNTNRFKLLKFQVANCYHVTCDYHHLIVDFTNILHIGCLENCLLADSYPFDYFKTNLILDNPNLLKVMAYWR